MRTATILIVLCGLGAAAWAAPPAKVDRVAERLDKAVAAYEKDAESLRAATLAELDLGEQKAPRPRRPPRIVVRNLGEL